jgi:ribonuclease J
MHTQDVHRSLKLVVHRATNVIGGNCIELATSNGSRVLLDIGRPLDAAREATGLLPRSLDLSKPLDGVLISHPHQDHYGLLEETPADWPVYCGEATSKLMRLTAEITGKALDRDFRFWRSGVQTSAGEFTITPYLTDHSAFDAHMLLIEADGKRILYTGDFRVHGRKSTLVARLTSSLPRDIDVLLMEGTNLGSDKRCVMESELEADFVRLFKETAGRVFVAWSAKNIDRTVTLYRACLKTKRTLVVDLYTADVLSVLACHGRIPQPGWANLKVVITRAFARLYRRRGRADFVDRMAKFGIPAAKLAEGKWVTMIRPSLMRDFEPAGVVPDAKDAWSWSMWRGYLKNDGIRLRAWFDAGGARADHIHTSGHASASDLRHFASAISAKTMVPVHGEAWDREAQGFPHITRFIDGEPLEV